MIDRTKAIASAKIRQPDYYFVSKDEVKVEPGPINLKKLKPHSLRYEEIIRKNKEDLR